MSIIRFLLPLLLTVVIMSDSLAQDALFTHWQPAVSITKKFNSRWSGNFTGRGLVGLWSFGEQESEAFSGLQRLDARLFATRTFFDLSSASLGYMYRDYTEDDRQHEHRLSEQYVIINNGESWRLAHRFLAEQRFFASDWQGRLRYRISGERPVKGRKLNAREAYFLASEEVVFAFDSEDTGLENRLLAGLGIYLKPGRRFEIRLQHRFSGRERNQHFFLMTNYYLKF